MSNVKNYSIMLNNITCVVIVKFTSSNLTVVYFSKVLFVIIPYYRNETNDGSHCTID